MKLHSGKGDVIYYKKACNSRRKVGVEKTGGKVKTDLSTTTIIFTAMLLCPKLDPE